MFSLYLVLLTLLAAFVVSSQRTPRRGGNAAVPAELVHQYAPITWVENLAVRPNGWLLPITTTSAVLNQLDPRTGELRLVHDFSSAGNAVQGITEVLPDLYAVNVLTCNITALTCTQGSVTTWTVDLRHHSNTHAGLSVKKVASFPTAGFLNGMATLSGAAGLVLIADSFKGGIWRLNVHNGEKQLLFTDASMSAPAQGATGVNGIRVRPGALYFTNSALGTFNRISINARTGMKTGNATVIISGLVGPDDLEVDCERGVAYVCNGAANQLLSIPLNEGNMAVVADVPGPTSARWADGREERLYVSTVGGLLQYVQGNVTVGGAVYEIV